MSEEVRRVRGRCDTDCARAAARRSVAFLATAMLAVLASTAPTCLASPPHPATSRVVAWGNNTYDQLGVENPGPEFCPRRPGVRGLSCSRTPITVPGLGEAIAVEAESNWANAYSVALLRNGTVMEWGGAWSAGGGALPRPVLGLNDVKAISRGPEHGVALLANGTVMEWAPGSSSTPVGGLTEVTSIAPHGVDLAVLRNGTVMSWLGGSGEGATPEPVAGLSDVRSVSAAGCCGLALLRDGAVVRWGNNQSGCLGSDSSESFIPPTRIDGLGRAAAVAVGGRGPWTQCYVLLHDGMLVSLRSAGPEPVLRDVAAISLSNGGGLGLALHRNGTVGAFAEGDGAGLEGAFGDGTAPWAWPPPLVSGLTHATAIAAAGKVDYNALLDEAAFGLAVSWQLTQPRTWAGSCAGACLAQRAQAEASQG